jgi:hypothetical protein
MTDLGTTTDGALLSAVRSGDGESFAIFYRRHRPAVVALLVRETGDREVAADLAAEVFAAVLVSARRFRPRDWGSAWPLVRTIARRGSAVSSAGETFDQHFAIALDGKLVTVPSIDFRTYPDGIPGGNSADITGGFTARGARDMAVLLRFGPLPVALVAR